MSEWKETTIGEQITLQRGFDITKAEQREGSVPVISSGGISSFHDTAAVKGPGVVLGRKGVVGSVYYTDNDFWPHDTTLWVKDFHENAPHFVYYYFKWIAPRIASMDVGSANPTLNRNHVHPIKIKWPPLPVQKRIAEILGSLDEKIELNRRTSATLEQMAQALFKSWFVDFDPVQAKAAGKRPKNLAPEIARLFPDEFEDSLLGPVPKEWTVGSLGDIAKNSKINILAEEIGSHISYIALDHMPKKSLVLAVWSCGESVESNKTKFQKNDILFGKLRPYFHKVGIAPVDGVCSTDILVIVPKTQDWFGFAACHFSSESVIQHADRTSSGTRMPRTNWNDLSQYPVALPPQELAAEFSGIFRGIMEKIHTCVFESRTLSALRDTLLPKLMGGELLEYV